jgi:hypothetical protein
LFTFCSDGVLHFPKTNGMKIWIDAQLPPTLASWLSATFDLEASSLRDLSLRDAQDIQIFAGAVSGKCRDYDER